MRVPDLYLWTRYSDWALTVFATDDDLSAAEVMLARLRCTMWDKYPGRVEMVDTLTRGLTESGPVSELAKYCIDYSTCL